MSAIRSTPNVFSVSILVNRYHNSAPLKPIRIKKLKSSPPIWFGLLFQVAGAVAAIIIRSLGRLMIFKSGVWIEKRAIKDYNLFLKKIKFDIETITLIRKIIIDEERHVSTWQNSIEILKD